MTNPMAAGDDDHVDYCHETMRKGSLVVATNCHGK